MTKEIPELITECWQLLVEYIPRRDHLSAAEQLYSYLETVLSREELTATADLDGDLMDAQTAIEDQNEDFEEPDDDYDE